MSFTPERRRDARIPLPHRPGALTRGRAVVRVLDLSPDGARIEHPDRLPPGAEVLLALPVSAGFLTRPSKVVWCTQVQGRVPLQFQSGICFTHT